MVGPGAVHQHQWLPGTVDFVVQTYVVEVSDRHSCKRDPGRRPGFVVVYECCRLLNNGDSVGHNPNRRHNLHTVSYVFTQERLTYR